MDEDVEARIAALRAHLGAQHDADLAAKLGIGKSTISSWRSRGRIPERFLRVLDGESHEPIATPPRGWGDHERAAFDLALFRFTLLFGPLAREGHCRDAMVVFSNTSIFWLMMHHARKDLVERMEAAGHQLQVAFAVILYEEREAPSETAKALRERLGSQVQLMIDWRGLAD
jgi:hypothetical protein